MIESLSKNAICISCDEQFIESLYVPIISMIEHSSKDNFYDIVILSDTDNLILNIDLPDNFSIRCFNMNELMEGKCFLLTINTLSYATYYRMFIPTIFSKYEKVIYLDSDIMIRKDIYELFSEYNDNLLLGATQFFDIYYSNSDGVSALKKRCEKVYDIKVTDYFPSGVMIFNIKKCLEYNLVDKMITLLDRHILFSGNDNDMLCMLVKGNFWYINLNWNAELYYLNSDRIYDLFDGYDLWSDPYIVHYMGYKKPLDLNDDSIPYIEEYKKYKNLK